MKTYSRLNNIFKSASSNKLVDSSFLAYPSIKNKIFNIKISFNWKLWTNKSAAHFQIKYR